MDKFPIMKSGIGTPYDTMNMSDDEMLDIGTLLTVFVKNGMKNACKYVEHSGRYSMTEKDIKYALQMEIFLFMKRDDLVSDLTEIRQEIADYIENGSSNEDEEDEEDDEDEEDMEDSSGSGSGSSSGDYVEEEFSESTCDCVTCKCMNEINKRFPDWEPTSPLEEILKKRIIEISEETLEAFKELEEEYEEEHADE